VWTNINTNSPRQLDIPMSMGIIDFAAAGQATIMTPFTLSGAMAPVSLAGALVLQHIEALAAITLSQVVRAGAPIVYGAFTSNVDMKSGAPAFGTPEGVKAAIASGQLARHIDVPWRSQAASTSNTEDAQGGYETMLSMMACLMGGANVVVHAAGWQEGGLTASLEKFVLDVEMLQIIAETFQPVVLDDAELAIDAIDDVGPGGHFFGTAAHARPVRDGLLRAGPSSPARTSASGPTAARIDRRPSERTTCGSSWLRRVRTEPPLDDAVHADASTTIVARRTAAGGVAARVVTTGNVGP
jgi:trimethylamine--corrinoid protein Co-methyltransferase